MTIFTMKGGKIEPVAIIQTGKTTRYADFIAKAGAAVTAAAATVTGVAKDAAKEIAKDASKAVEAAKDAVKK